MRGEKSGDRKVNYSQLVSSVTMPVKVGYWFPKHRSICRWTESSLRGMLRIPAQLPFESDLRWQKLRPTSLSGAGLARPQLAPKIPIPKSPCRALCTAYQHVILYKLSWNRQNNVSSMLRSLLQQTVDCGLWAGNCKRGVSWEASSDTQVRIFRWKLTNGLLT